MLAETVVFLAFTFFQVVGALVLLQKRDGPRAPMRLLALLLLLNATLTTISAARSAGLRSSELNDFEHAVDLPTGALLLAFFFARSRLPHRERWMVGALGLGAIQFVAALVWPAIQTTWYVPAIAYPYYAAMTLVAVACAGGERWERWVALAFLPRMYYFAAQAFFGVSTTGSVGAGGVELNYAGVYVMALVGLVAVWRLARGPEVIPHSALAAGLLVGPAMAVSQATFPLLTDSANAVLNFVSLALARPFFQYVGLVPGDLPAILARSALASGVASIVAGGAPLLFGYPAAFSAMMGLGTGLLALAAVEALPRRDSPASDAAEAPTDSPTPPAPPGERTLAGIPQWQRLLAELRGSSRHQGLGKLAWTQKELSRRTGISVQRVSEFPAMMNATAGAKLDLLLPGWRAEHPDGEPVLVEVHKGIVDGASGVRVYYRLTVWGERMASTIPLTDSELRSSLPVDSGRIPGQA